VTTGAERVVTLRTEIPISMPPLIQEMLEDLEDLEKPKRNPSSVEGNPKRNPSVPEPMSFFTQPPGSGFYV